MGRRKIEIRAIKDDRNRSVTFLKRKGGLFKKAHELSVLCSVDVAVIIFGHNKKLYEFSSGDIQETIGRYQYYGGAHEHKGPEDFMGKKDGDDDDEEEEIDDTRPESRSPPQPMMAHHLQNQAAFQHMGTPSQSPPMPNGTFQHPHRGPSPHPPQNISRPGSRAHMRHPSSNLLPPQHQQHLQVTQGPPQQQQPSYAYMPNPPIYNPQAAAGMQMRPQPGQPHPPQFQQYQHPPSSHPQQLPPQHPPQHAQVQQVYQQEQRRSGPPPGFPQQQQPNQQQQQQQHPQDQRAQPQPSPQPQHAHAQYRPQPQGSPQPQHAQFSSPPIPPPKPLPASKTASIFTPIDDTRSLLAQHWGNSNAAEQPTSEPAPLKIDTGGRAQSIDVASISRTNANGVNGSGPSQQQSNPTSHPPGPPERTASTPIIPSIHAPIPPSRTNSMQADPRRPRLKVQIPSEDSGDERTAGSSPQAQTGAQMTPVREGGHTGVVLPPPSPSASALLSAGASGPPNPFARPAPPPVNGSFGRSGEMETPISALPSRFVSDQLLPSPSSFYNDWGFGRDNNMLPSPLAFPTPVGPNGGSFRDEDADKKRKVSDGDGSGGTPEKRIKT